jgi:hypothetical protein
MIYPVNEMGTGLAVGIGALFASKYNKWNEE